jgi:hypothetical protein
MASVAGKSTAIQHVQGEAMSRPNRDTIKLHIMSVSINYSKLLSSLHQLHNIIRDDAESATMVEEAIYALDGVPKLRQHLREKYGLSKLRNE